MLCIETPDDFSRFEHVGGGGGGGGLDTVLRTLQPRTLGILITIVPLASVSNVISLEHA